MSNNNNNQVYQDWDPVIIKKRPNRGKQDTNAAQRNGELTTVKKYGAGTNKNHVIDKNLKKLDEETEELSHSRVGLSIGQRIQQARIAKKMTQKDLARQICEKPGVVSEYEQGRAIPNNNILTKMERILGVKLRGENKPKAKK